jgi:hypothetical protein
MPEGL